MHSHHRKSAAIPLSTRDVTGIPLLKPRGKNAHQRRQDRIDDADKAGRIRLHNEIRPDGRNQIKHSPCRGKDAVRSHEDRITQRRFPVVVVFRVMRG